MENLISFSLHNKNTLVRIRLGESTIELDVEQWEKLVDDIKTAIDRK